MQSERWNIVAELYYRASELSDDRRATFLQEECGQDQNLIEEIESLVKNGATSQSVLDKPAMAIFAKEIASGQLEFPAPLLEGKTISHYRVMDRIGSGGMGVVYKAEDLKLRRLVALKLLPTFLAIDPEALQRFEREAQAASALNHPNICTVFEVDEAEGMHFIAIELLDGATLKECISHGPLQLTEIIRIGIQICDALESAHSVGIVHRDIKPSNVILTRRGIVKLLDFGVAKRLDLHSAQDLLHMSTPGGTQTDLQLTTLGTAIGTTAYMSPEQTDGQEVDARSDLFSLGTVLYEMATGKHPFPGKDIAEVLHAIRFQSPSLIKERNSAVPIDFVRITTRAMMKDRAQRYQEAAAMRADLESVRDHLEKKAGKKKAVFAGVLTIALLVAVGSASWRVPLVREWISEKPLNVAPEVKSLAVLPLKNQTGDESQEYFVDGMTDALISNLAQIKSLRIISRDSTMGYKNSTKTPIEIAKELNVDVLVAGVVVRSGDSVSIEAQLIRPSSRQPVWTNTYRRPINDITSLYSEVSQAIASEVQAQLTPQEQFRLSNKQTVNPQAYEFYLMGRYCWNKRTPDGYDTAIQFFQRALAVQPDYAQAYAGLADSIAFLGVWRKRGLSRTETVSLARANALRALQLDDNLAEAHASLASISYLNDWNWPLAEQEFRRAIELDPNYASAHHWYAYYCFSRNRVDEGLGEIHLAQQLDPQSLIIQNDVGQLLYMARRYDEAIEQEQRTLEMDGSLSWPHRWLGLSYLAKQQYSKAIAELQSAVRLSDRNLTDMALLGIAYARTGHVAKAHQVLRDIRAFPAEQYESVAEVAWLLVELGQADEAYESLVKALPDRPTLRSLHLLPYLDPFRSDPRFQSLQRRVGLP
jgi:serine/threonine-protein kinase